MGVSVEACGKSLSIFKNIYGPNGCDFYARRFCSIYSIRGIFVSKQIHHVSLPPHQAFPNHSQTSDVCQHINNIFYVNFFFIKMFNFHSLSVIKNLNTVESLLPSISVYKELLVECSGSNIVQVGVLQIQTHKRQV